MINHLENEISEHKNSIPNLNSHKYQLIETVLGEMLSVFSQQGLKFFKFVEKQQQNTVLAELEKKFGPIHQKDSQLSIKLQSELDEYFQKKRKNFSIPLDIQGTAFKKKSWEILLQITYGTTISYSSQAHLIYQPNAHRAVANANAQNPIHILIPCHRVISSSGALSGYSGGVERKKILLELERGS